LGMKILIKLGAALAPSMKWWTRERFLELHWLGWLRMTDSSSSSIQRLWYSLLAAHHLNSGKASGNFPRLFGK
jgi:hypothetical protein